MITLLAITGLGVLCLLFEIFNLRKFIVPFTTIGLLAALGLTISTYDVSSEYFNNMVITDNYSVVFSSLFILLTTFLVAMSHEFYRDHPTKISDFVSIKIFLLAGAVAMVSFGNLAMFFLGLEILSIALYILASSERLSFKSNEAGMKYFLMGAFASGIVLFGICLIYGATGSFEITEIYALSTSGLMPSWFFIGMALLTIGMLFKIAAVPFHFWAPDVYEGSPNLTAALMSTLTKVVAIAALYKLITGMAATIDYKFQILIVTISIASMVIGNIMALRQDNVKRMLAFSGISHAGFMLMVFLSNSPSQGTLLYYAAAYALSGIAAFAVLIHVCQGKDNENILNFNGLGKTNPFLAAMLTSALLSMGGIPIFSGFFAKFMLFTQTIQSGYLYVVIVAVMMSIVSIGYYFKLILAMYTKDATETTRPVPVIYSAVAGIAILINVLMGLFPSAIIDLL